MGREIRQVPPNWEHPKYTTEDAPYSNRVGQYIPLHEGYEAALEEFAAKIASDGLAEAIEYFGGGPRRDDYVHFEVEPSWFQMYETVSEGTPVTPPFKTKEKLVAYLVANGDFWDQNRRKEGYQLMDCSPWTHKQAATFVYGAGWAPSLIVVGGAVVEGARFVEKPGSDGEE